MIGTKQALANFSKNFCEYSGGKPLNSSKWWANILSELPDSDEYFNRLKLDLEASKTEGVKLLTK